MRAWAPNSGPNRIVVLAAVAALVVVSLSLLIPRLANWPVTPDFTVLWTAGRFALIRPHDVYDWNALTAAQMSLRPPVGPLPFPYPPSALPVMAPFALLPFWPAFWLWTAVSAALFWTAARRITPAAPLVFAAPHVVLVLLLGQTTLLVGALLIWGVTLVRDRPALAGLLLGIAASIKPQSAILLPVALLAGRHWVAIGGACAGFVAMALLSLPFGISLWADWLRALRDLPAIVSGYGLDVLGASPRMALTALGLPLWLHGVFVLLAVALVWRAFRAEDTKRRILVLVAATLLASPYAIRYELANLAPSLVDALLAGTIRGLLIALPLFALNVFTIVPALVVSALTASGDKEA